MESTQNAGAQIKPPPVDWGKKGICVIVPHGEKPVKMSGDKAEDFLPFLGKSALTWINFSVDDVHEADHIATILGFSSSLVQTLLGNHISGYEDFESELGIVLPAVKVRKFEVKIHPLLILIRQGLLVTVHETDVVRLVKFARYADTFMRKIKQDIPWNDKQTILLNRIIDENNSANFDNLRQIEEQGGELSRYLMAPAAPMTELGGEIYEMKRALITYLDALWATIDVLNSLRYGDAEMISDNPKILGRIDLLLGDVNSKISISEHVSEVLVSGLGVLQTIYNNQLQILNNRLTIVNNRLAMVTAWLAIIGAAVMVPNTLATIFGIPAVSDAMQNYVGTGAIWAVLIISTILSALGVYIVLKRRGWIPEKPE